MNEREYKRLRDAHRFKDEMVKMLDIQWERQQIEAARIAEFRAKIIKSSLKKCNQWPRFQYTRFQYLTTDQLMKVAAAIAHLHDVMEECSMVNNKATTINNSRDF